KSTWNKLGVWALIGVTGLGLLNACGDGEEKDATATAEQLADLKEGEDVVTIAGLWWGNVNRCNNNKTIEDCADGVESGGLRFKSKKDSFWGAVFEVFAGEDLGRSGCTFRGDGEKVKCRVSCDRISNSLGLGKSLCDSHADGCKWNEKESKCEKDNIQAIKNIFGDIHSGIKKVLGDSNIASLDDLYQADYDCGAAGLECKGITRVRFKRGCTKRGEEKKCLSSCKRIRKKYLCVISSGCIWSSKSCEQKK
ncbi:MAG: hypothetical protein AAF471_00910, partial [Myxococcota bacterium]